MSTPRSDELLFAAGGDVWEKYGTFVKRTLPEEERGSFSRFSDATYTDRSGNLRTAESGVLRPHYVSSESSYSARLEAARTNELHNSDSPATQTRNLTAGTYTLWMEGSGSVDASGATDGSYGTATEGQSNDLTFTVSAQQDVTFTVNNTVTRFQCEEGSFRSSFIATAGSAVSRGLDDFSFPVSFSVQELTAYMKVVNTFDAFNDDSGSVSNNFFRIVDENDNPPRLNVFRDKDNAGLFTAFYADEDGDNVFPKDSTEAVNLSPGDVVELVTQLEDGKITIRTFVNGSDTADGVQTESNSSVGVSGEWSGGAAEIHLGRSGALPAHDVITGPIIAPGVRTMDEMRSIEV